MTLPSYKEKLLQFNATEKYQRELAALEKALDIKPKEKILDYGCGTGFALFNLMHRHNCEVFGYDANDYFTGNRYFYRNELFFRVDKAYFMHSFAHIPRPERQLIQLRTEFLKAGGRIVIITPDADWLKKNQRPGYIPDPTVIRHYTGEELRLLVECAGFTVTEYGTTEDEERIVLIAHS